LHTDNPYIYGPNDSWTTVIQQAIVLQTPISRKCNVLDWCFLPGNPFHTTKLSADHRTKWMSAYLLPFPTHAKSEHHTAFRQ